MRYTTWYDPTPQVLNPDIPKLDSAVARTGRSVAVANLGVSDAEIALDVQRAEDAYDAARDAGVGEMEALQKLIAAQNRNRRVSQAARAVVEAENAARDTDPSVIAAESPMDVETALAANSSVLAARAALDRATTAARDQYSSIEEAEAGVEGAQARQSAARAAQSAAQAARARASRFVEEDTNDGYYVDGFYWRSAIVPGRCS